MSAALWLPPLIKAVSTALLVVLAATLAEALGPFWGSLIVSLPVSAGPAYVFLAMRHDADFVAASALGSAAANAATGLFLIVYAALAGKAPLWRSLGTAVMTWFAAALAIRQVDWTPATAMLLNLIVYGIGFILPGPAANAAEGRVIATRRLRFDLPLRAIAVALFVSAVVLASSQLGPEATGIAAVFPISLISLLVILQPRIGGPASARLAATALQAMLGFGVMLVALHLAIRPWGTVTAFVAALFVSVSWSGGLFILRHRLQSRTRRHVQSV
jgi:hypothetical protein